MMALLLSAALAFSPQDAAVAYRTAKSLVEECTPRDAGTIRGSIAANKILDLASETGADVYRDRFIAEGPSGKRQYTNLYAEFERLPSAKWVVLVSHFDTKAGVPCPGANDGASTSGLLTAFAGVLHDSRDLAGNVMLVWTDAEECVNSYSKNDGFQGSRRAVEHLKEKGYKVQAVLCLDMLGDKDLKITIPANGTPTLAKIACHAARRIGEPDLVWTCEEIVKDDHVPFLEAGFPAIDLIDFSYGPDNVWWHSAKDTMENISESSLLKSGRLVAEMLNILL